MNTQTTNTAYQISYDILERLAEELTNNEGNIFTEIEAGDMLVVFEGRYSIVGGCDNHYYCGTGANYLTYASVSLSCSVYDSEGEEVANNYTDAEFEKYLLN